MCVRERELKHKTEGEKEQRNFLRFSLMQKSFSEAAHEICFNFAAWDREALNMVMAELCVPWNTKAFK